MTGTARKAFQIFPWHQPFLPALKDYLDRITGNRPGRALIITPNTRPWQYLADLYRHDGLAQVLPAVLPFSKVVSIWRAGATPQPAAMASSLDMASLLHDCVREAAREDCGLAEILSHMELFRFLPWGFRLASLLEELATHGLDPKDILYAENDVAPPAAQLLGALGGIGKLWRQRLNMLGWSTEGTENYLAIKSACEIPQLLRSTPERPVVIAGFYALNGVEDALLKALWEDGAHVCLHTAPELACGQDPPWSCRAHKRWLESWHARCEPAKEHAESHACKYSYFAGYDTHSQLKELASRLETGNRPGTTAVILSRPDLLLPVLHHLPQKDVNISMGYPVTRAPVHKLVCDLFQLQLNRSPAGHYYWRDILRIFHQPHVKMLAVEQGNQQRSLRTALSVMESRIRSGGKFANMESVASIIHSGMIAHDDPEAGLFQEVLGSLIFDFARITTPASLADALQRLIDLFISHGENVIHAFPLDAEALVRMQNSVIPVLRQCLIARESLPLETLYEIFRQLMEAERIPFSAYPLEGTQILGLLETRLLHFERIFVLDATDDVLPGGVSQDPLLPDSLRPMLGLPDSRSRQNVIAHALARICASASEAHFFWQEDTGKSGLFDAKKSRSRFVEQLLWQEEQKRGKLVEPGDGMPDSPQIKICLRNRQPRHILKSAVLEQKLDAFLARGISATALDAYLLCPFRFAQEYLLQISAANEVVEGDNAMLVGDLLHDSLKEYYEPFLGKDVRQSDLDAERIIGIFQRKATDKNLKKILPLPSFAMLELAVPVRLKNFVQNQPEITHIDALEHWLAAQRSIMGKNVRVMGKIDRLDIRDDKYVLLDYKTGKTRKCPEKIWTDEDFFSGMTASASEPGSAAGSRMQRIRSEFPSLQLPFYVQLLPEEKLKKFGNAGFVQLGSSGREIMLVQARKQAGPGEVAARCRNLVDYILRDLLCSEQFEPCENDLCEFCAYSRLCSR